MYRLCAFVSDVITSGGNVSKDVRHDASFYGVHLCAWMLMDSLRVSKCKNSALTFLPRRCFIRRKALFGLAYFLMTFACPAAIASRAALDVFAPVIAALSSVLLFCWLYKNNAATFLPRRCV